MGGSDKTASPAQTGQTTSNSSNKVDEELDKTRVRSQTSATPALNDEMSEGLDSAARTRRWQRHTTNNSSTHVDAGLDRAQASLQQSAAPAQNETSDTVTSPARRDRGTLASAPELNARLELVLAHLLKKATAALHDSGAPTTSASTSMTHTRQRVLKYDQSTCPLFRLPPELRNNIYTYVAYSKFYLPQFEWDEEHNSPKLNLKCAQPRAPANELLRTCRSIYDESEGIFVRAKTQFWSDTTFTLALPTWPPHHSFGYLECLTDEQVSHMTRVNIKIEGSQPFTVHLRSGPEADSSVTYPSRVAGCNHRSLLTAPLSFVKRVIASDQLEGQLSYHDVLTILWQMSRGLARPSVPFCVEHQKKPVVLSLQNMSRAGLMAVVAWTCDGSRCGRI